ncbi:MAG: translocation/assembly module TamB domain-containing protein, partial [Chitinophagaceae bacterium]
FLGSAKLYHIDLYKNKARIDFDSLDVNSKTIPTGKELSFQGNEMEGFIRGHYDIQDITGSFLNYLKSYFPSIIKRTLKFDPDENFNFQFSFGKVDQFLMAFTQKFYGLNDSQLTGGLSDSTGKLNIDATIPSMGYDNYRFDRIKLDWEGTLKKLSLLTTVGGIFSNDSLLFPGASIQSITALDTSMIRIKTKATSTLNNADIYARFITLKDGFRINILKSLLTVNNKLWTITPDNEISITKSSVQVKHFNIFHNNQTITLTSNDANSHQPSFLINLKSLNISDFTQFFTQSTRFEGIADGKIVVDDPLGKLHIQADLAAQYFRMNNDSIGNMQFSGSYDKGNGFLNMALKSDDQLQTININGKIGLTASNDQINISTTFNHRDFSLIEPYISDYVSQLKGEVTGKLTIGGTRAVPQVNGNLQLDHWGFKVNYLGTYYTFSKAILHFTPSYIDLGSITLVDKYKNTALLTGKIDHQNFTHLYFNCLVQTSKFLFLNTTYLDNTMYYGDVFGNGTVNFYGPLQDMQMDITASPMEGTLINLPLSDNLDIGKHNFIIFKSYGTELNPNQNQGNKTNLTVRINAALNNLAKINVIIDPTTGDAIVARGNGTLKMEIPLNGNMSMYGNYSIEKGTYYFTFQRLLSRKFRINSGSTISWNGSPSDAYVNVSAIYDVPGGASLYDLISGEIGASGIALDNSELQADKVKQRVEVYLNLTGKLSHPTIGFDIKLPDQSLSSGVYAVSRLEQIRQDPNKNALLTQVSWLLLFGQFAPASPGTGNSNALRSGGLASVGAILSSQVNSQLNNLFGKALKTKSIGLNIGYNNYTESGVSGDPLQRNELKLGITKSFFNDRVKLELGPGLDWGKSNTGLNAQPGNNSAFAGDFQFEYLVSPDGRLVATAFSRSNYDVYKFGNLTRSGIGISYKREFDKLSDLFSRKQKKKKTDTLQLNSVLLQPQVKKAPINKTNPQKPK